MSEGGAGWRALLDQEDELRERLGRLREMRVAAEARFPELVPTLDEALLALEEVVTALGRARADAQPDVEG